MYPWIGILGWGNGHAPIGNCQANKHWMFSAWPILGCWIDNQSLLGCQTWFWANAPRCHADHFWVRMFRPSANSEDEQVPKMNQIQICIPLTSFDILCPSFHPFSLLQVPHQSDTSISWFSAPSSALELGRTCARCIRQSFVQPDLASAHLGGCHQTGLAGKSPGKSSMNMVFQQTTCDYWGYWHILPTTG